VTRALTPAKACDTFLKPTTIVFLLATGTPFGTNRPKKALFLAATPM